LSALRVPALAALLVLAAAGAAHAQLFIGSRPNPELSVGPVIVRASVTPGVHDVVIVDVLWTLNAPPGKSAAGLEQTIYFLWPGQIVADPHNGPADPALDKSVEDRGFTVIEDGRVALFAQSAYQLESDAPAEKIDGGAPFVTFVRQGGVLGLTSPASEIRIAWHPKMTNRAWLMNLRFQARGLIKRKPATWEELTFWGERYRFELAFNDFRSRALFPIYLENRDRVLRLTDDPSELVVLFPAADRLKIDEISPGSATRNRHESLENTEVVARYLDASEGLVPQTLDVQFGYFTGVQSWSPLLIPVVFFILGNVVRPPLQAALTRIGRTFVARIHIGPAANTAPERESGVVLSRDDLARIVPGQTTREQVLQIAGGGPEEFEQLQAPDRRTLIYRGRRVVPRRSRRLPWVATIQGWDVEHHEVEIELERDVVRDVQARVRRTHQSDPPPVAPIA
jgi:hypothetical protein